MRVKAIGYLRMRTSDYYTPEQRFYISDLKSDSEYSVVVRQITLDEEIPDFDPRPQMIAALQKERDEVRAKFAQKVAEMDQRISELQAIEYTPEQS